MKTAKKMGVWMDHSMAHLMEFSSEPFEIKTIESSFTNQNKKEQELQAMYYKKLGNALKDFYHVVLFGPTDAKLELYHLLQEDPRFQQTKMEIKDTDKMTPRQQQAFVRKYFSKA
jgi:hypothetical protein